jgi:hypothetical protein
MKVNVSSANLGPCESVIQLLIGLLCKGIVVQVTVGEKTYDGVVYNIDMSPGPQQDYVFADVHVPELDEQADDGLFSVKVSIHKDGTVNVMPPPTSAE